MITRPAPARAATWVGFAAWLVAGGLTAFVMREHGFGAQQQMRWVLIQVCVVLVPGWVLSTWASRAPWFGRVAAAFVTGIPIQLLGWLFGVTTGITALMWVVPLVIAGAAGWFLRKALREEISRRRPPIPGWASLSLALLWISILARFTSAWAQNPAGALATRWYQDMYWHLSLNASAMERVLLRDPQAVGEPLQYHWFTNAFVGGLARAADLDLLALTSVAWAVAPFAATLGLAFGLAHHLTGSAWVGVLASTLVAFPPSFALDPAISGGTTTNFILLSPSHMMGLPFLLGVSWVIVVLLREDGSTAQVLPALGGLLLASPGIKISLLPVVFCGLALAFAVALVTRRRRAALGALTGIVLAVVGATYPLFGGGGGGSTISLFGGLRERPVYRASQDYLEAEGTMVGLLVLGGFIVLTLLNHLWTVVGVAGFRWRDPVGWFMLGTIGSALGVTLVLLHPGQSQIYFALGVQPLAAVVAAVGLGALVRRWRSSHGAQPLVTVLAPVALLALLVGSWVLGRSRIESLDVSTIVLHLGILVVLGALLITSVRAWGLRPALAVAATALVAFSIGPQVWRSADPRHYRMFSREEVAEAFAAARPPAHEVSADEFEAARALARLTPDDSVVATNVHCRNVVSEPGCDARAFWVGGLGERQMLLGGWAYTTLGRSTHGEGGRSYVSQPYPDTALHATNEEAFANPSPEAMRALRERGVTHLFADSRAGTVSDRLDEFCRTLYENATVTVCELS